MVLTMQVYAYEKTSLADIPKNTQFPRLGAAYTPYARTVSSQIVLPAALPDPGTLFDSVMVRKKFEAHPNEISSILFYLASIIIHGKLFFPSRLHVMILHAKKK